MGDSRPRFLDVPRPKLEESVGRLSPTSPSANANASPSAPRPTSSRCATSGSHSTYSPRCQEGGRLPCDDLRRPGANAPAAQLSGRCRRHSEGEGLIEMAGDPGCSLASVPQREAISLRFTGRLWRCPHRCAARAVLPVGPMAVHRHLGNEFGHSDAPS